MARLIDAEKAVEEMYLEDAQIGSTEWESFEVEEFLNRQPTVDAVEVVRCRDCKHFVSPQGVPVCACFYGLGFPNHSGEDFCSYGERNTDGP